jgi:hypothetical protein
MTEETQGVEREEGFIIMMSRMERTAIPAVIRLMGAASFENVVRRVGPYPLFDKRHASVRLPYFLFVTVIKERMWLLRGMVDRRGMRSVRQGVACSWQGEYVLRLDRKADRALLASLLELAAKSTEQGMNKDKSKSKSVRKALPSFTSVTLLSLKAIAAASQSGGGGGGGEAVDAARAAGHRASAAKGQATAEAAAWLDQFSETPPADLTEKLFGGWISSLEKRDGPLKDQLKEYLSQLDSGTNATCSCQRCPARVCPPVRPRLCLSRARARTTTHTHTQMPFISHQIK